jgi:hypothetical protein
MRANADDASAMMENAMSDRFYCPLPVLTMRTVKRKGETEAQYRQRFERAMARFDRLLDLRVKLESALSR